MALKLFLAGLLLMATGLAQNWEIGGGVGEGVYKNATITGAAGTADAGIRNRYVATAVVNEDLWEHFSGEFRYIYHGGDTFLQSGSTQGSIVALSHTFTYDALLHIKDRGSRFRPYVAFGAGAKYYGTSGSTPKPQPLPAIAGLTTQSQWEPVLDFGGGVKVRVTEHVVVSGDVRDYITRFPNHLFPAASGARASGVLQQVTPMVGIGYRF